MYVCFNTAAVQRKHEALRRAYKVEDKNIDIYIHCDGLRAERFAPATVPCTECGVKLFLHRTEEGSSYLY